MDANTIVTVITCCATAAGGYVGGRRIAGGQAVSTAVEVVELLQVQVATLTQQSQQDATKITELRTRVEILENLVTQRAEVEAVHIAVDGVREVVDRIAEAVGA